MITRFSHWSLAVSYLDQSSAFYESVLGCERVGHSHPGAAVGTDASVIAVQMERDGQRFELLQFDPPANPPRARPQCNHLGLSHLTVAIDSAESLIPELDHRGVAVRHHTLGSFVPEPDTADQQFLFEDPDGNLIETYAPLDPLTWDVFAPPSSMEPTSAPAVAGVGVVQHLSHLSLCVADPQGSIPFYEHVLGLELVAAMDWTGPGPSRVMDVGDAALTTWLFTRDGQRIELINFDRPAGPPRPKPQLNHLGLSHLTVEVDDLAATAASLRQAGIALRTSQSNRSDGPGFLFEDPEGNLIQAVGSTAQE